MLSSLKLLHFQEEHVHIVIVGIFFNTNSIFLSLHSILKDVTLHLMNEKEPIKLAQSFKCTTPI